MVSVMGDRKEIFYLCVSFSVFYATVFQVQPASCAAPEILKRILRSIPRPNHQTIASLEPDQTLYSPKTPFLGELTENLKVGSIIRIYGYLPKDLRRFDINLCKDCWEGPIQFHLSARFDPLDFVRNSYGPGGWGFEERESSSSEQPFQLGHEFVLQIEVNTEDYSISVDGHQTWTFAHRLPYSTVDKLEIGGPMLIWKIEYTDKSHEMEKQKYQLEGDVTSRLSIDIKSNPASMFEKFTMDLKCVCTPHSSSTVESEPDYEDDK